LSVFAFLITDHGLRCTHADQNLITYESQTLFVVVYHDPRSYEVGVDLGKLGDGSKRRRSFALVELMRLESQRKAEDFCLPAVVKSDQMRPALVNLAELLKTYGGRVLSGDLSVLTQVRNESARFERELATETRLQRVKSTANAAFREQQYLTAAALYESIEEDLSPAESRKLQYAKKRIQNAGFREGVQPPQE
jgi:hypothetical protein